MLKVKSKNRGILLTGGHAATTAISVVEELIRKYGKEGINISWIGTRFPIEGKEIGGLELKIFSEIKVKSYFFKLPISFIRAVYFILKIKPDVTLSFGGFAAFPVVFASWLFRIPVIIHEQTIALGLANKLSSIFAKEILLAKVVGNPVMTQICEVEAKQTISNPPVIFIMGGSRGSEKINDAVFSILPKLLEKYKIIHITGEAHFNKFAGIKDDNYQCFSFVSPLEIDNLYREADIVVSRSGANTVAELMIVKRPAILIPIPWSHQNEQAENAKIACNFGVARILPQENLSGRRLQIEIEKIIQDWDEITSKIKSKYSNDFSASSKVVDILEKYLK